jgi:hypothetical protein
VTIDAEPRMLRPPRRFISKPPTDLVADVFWS